MVPLASLRPLRRHLGSFASRQWDRGRSTPLSPGPGGRSRLFPGFSCFCARLHFILSSSSRMHWSSFGGCFAAIFACFGGCFAAIIVLVGDCFGRMLGHLGCVAWVDALPSLLSCSPFALLRLLYLLADSDVWSYPELWSCRAMGLCVPSPIVLAVLVQCWGCPPLALWCL